MKKNNKKQNRYRKITSTNKYFDTLKKIMGPHKCSSCGAVVCAGVYRGNLDIISAFKTRDNALYVVDCAGYKKGKLPERYGNNNNEQILERYSSMTYPVVDPEVQYIMRRYK